MKYYFKSKSKKYLLAVLLLISLCPLLGTTYSSFIFSSNDYRASEMYIGSLMYSIKINGQSTSKIIVEPGETVVNIEITSLNTVSSFYKLIYEKNENISVEYSSETTDFPSGDISNTRSVIVRITNSSSSNIEVEFDIVSGYITNTIDDVIIPSGYNEIIDFYNNDLADIGIAKLYVDGILVDSLDDNYYYDLVSYSCSNGETIEWNMYTKTIGMSSFNRQTACELHFNKLYTIIQRVLIDNPIIIDDNSNLFANVADEASESGLFRTTDLTKTEDMDGDGIGEEVLYFRGVVENNYLVFAGYCWRIVRTNESGESIKLRYCGDPKISGGTYTCPQTGTKVKIAEDNYFNKSSVLDNWYINNIWPLGEEITNLIIDEPYCNDMTLDGSHYGADIRLVTNKSPQYKCPNSNDNDSVSTSKGNGKLYYPIALLSADEVAYAGGVYDTSNLNYYLYTYDTYATNSRSMEAGSYLFLFEVVDDGSLESDNFNLASEKEAFLPVISLSNNAPVANGGTGVYNNPYVIVTE
ncbi:MAG: hypothetical protein IJB83_03140 [Bacilli bacterium]|nr:hypothetical protein [Bacilli bacterium]